jgi:hypothetical protein
MVWLEDPYEVPVQSFLQKQSKFLTLFTYIVIIIFWTWNFYQLCFQL